MTRDKSLTKIAGPDLSMEIETPCDRIFFFKWIEWCGGTEWQGEQQKNNGQRHQLFWPLRTTDPAEISFIRL